MRLKFELNLIQYAVSVCALSLIAYLMSFETFVTSMLIIIPALIVAGNYKTV